MSFFSKSPVVVRVVLILFVLAVLTGVFAFWQGCIVAVAALIVYFILRYIKQQPNNEALLNDSN